VLGLITANKQRGLALWDLLTVMSRAAAIGGALAAARDSGVGGAGELGAVAIGVVLGLGCIWTVWSAGWIAMRRIGAVLNVGQPLSVEADKHAR
jgi:hypothetical protein